MIVENLKENLRRDKLDRFYTYRTSVNFKAKFSTVEMVVYDGIKFNRLRRVMERLFADSGKGQFERKVGLIPLDPWKPLMFRCVGSGNGEICGQIG